MSAYPYALRVIPAETWLTVYRRLTVLNRRPDWPFEENRSSNEECSKSNQPKLFSVFFLRSYRYCAPADSYGMSGKIFSKVDMYPGRSAHEQYMRTIFWFIIFHHLKILWFIIKKSSLFIKICACKARAPGEAQTLRISPNRDATWTKIWTRKSELA